jgi:adenosylcobinamide-phosphate synthase
MLFSASFGWASASDLALIALTAFVIDLFFGDPEWLYRRIPHPVALFGKLVDGLERRLNRAARGTGALFWRGFILTVTLAGLAAVFGWSITALTSAMPGGVIVEAVLASTLIAYRGLQDHIKAVARGLKRSLAEARAEVAKIVGRDPKSLDGHAVARAAVESLAENFSDGVVAPLFWFLLLGLPGLCAYKAVNTLDSMIGHRTPRYEAFGKSAASLDDLVNWLPARLAGLSVVAAATFLPNADPKRALAVMFRDAPKHRSPNAGWQEAAFAGALDFALAGPRQYGGQAVKDSWMGDGRRDLTAFDVEQAIALYRIAGLLIVLTLVLVAWIAA